MNYKYTISDVELITLNLIESEDASLFIFESINEIFEIKRVFTVRRNKEDRYQRGRHAHKRDQQIVTCPYGSIRFTVSDGMKNKAYIIDSPEKAVYVPCYIWTETDYLESNTVVTVYSSQPYDEKSYIRDYGDFLKIVNQNRDIHKQ